MAKPYLSLVFPVTDSNRLDSMIGVVKADHLLQEAIFDYEILVVVSDSGSLYESMAKFASAIHNAKCIKAQEETISGLFRSGLKESGGVLRAIAFKNDFRFLKNFHDFIPLFKENEVIVGPKWNFSGRKFIPQLISATIHSPYGFQIINEEAVPLLTTKAKSEDWEFFSESHWRLFLAGKNIGSVEFFESRIMHNALDLKLWKDAATIRIHYLGLLIRNIFWFIIKKIGGLFQTPKSKYN